jgi:serine/threonine protein kinase
MPLGAGERFGAYEIVGPLGAGGMGEVYRATDPRLGRQVAIKILPHGVAPDPEQLARFDREARLLASLNHPHIGAIFGREESAGVVGLVLELVEGPTLAERLGRPMRYTDAQPLALQIIDGIAAAHESGIIHRDLKPGNIKVTPEGSIKILDFGLAKVATRDPSDPGLSQDATISMDRTARGTVLGTAAYMSPEQARGHDVDRRTDIWAFGCILFEMLTGRCALRTRTRRWSSRAGRDGPFADDGAVDNCCCAFTGAGGHRRDVVARIRRHRVGGTRLVRDSTSARCPVGWRSR